MMLCSTVLPLLVLLVTVHECSTAHHYYVTANNGSDCPLTFPCHPLNYYVQNAFSYFTSNTVVEFLPGLHELNCTGNVFILFARNLTLIGSDSHANTSTKCSHSDSIVFCKNYFGFVFWMIRDLKIVNLQFTHCGAAIYSESLPKVPFVDTFSRVYFALAVLYVHNLVISRVTVEKSYGFGLYAVNIWNKSVITDSCFISNNEYVGKYQQCIDPTSPATCTGGNFRLSYMDLPFPGIPANNSLEIYNSEFRRGVSTIKPEPQLGLAGGLEILVGMLLNNNIRITINNTVIAENSGMIAGNVYISIMFGVEHVAIRFDRCYIHSGSNWFDQVVMATGLTCGVQFVNEHANGNSMPVHISSTKFVSNYGGAVSLSLGGRDSCVCNSSAYQILIDSCEFSNNSAQIGHSGLAATIYSDKFNLRVPVQETVLKVRLVIQNSTFRHNYKMPTVYQQNVDLIKFFQLPEVEIIDSTFYSNIGSHTIIIAKSKVVFRGQVVFENNTSTTDGGALHLDESSLLHFEPNTRVLFTNNRASQRGGAIYVDNTKIESTVRLCFYELDEVQKYSQKNIQLVFEGNFAEIAGDALYGGQVDTCMLFPNAFPPGPYFKNIVDFKKAPREVFLNPFESLFNFTDKTPSHSLISSDPFRICFCSNASEPDFAVEQSIHTEAYPGQMFYVEAVAVGQYNGTTPGVVLARAVTSNTTSILKEVHLAQESKRLCTRLEYSISSISEFEVIQLVPAGVSRHLFYADINVTLLTCPPGFALQNATGKCDCHPLLNQYNVTCDIDNQTIAKADTAWISVDKSLASGVILHPECPFDYCKVGTVTFKLTENPEFQCAFSRTGVLCGACLPGLSLGLGTSKCLECSNVWLLLLLPFAVAGLVLVFVLLTLNLTVSTGTINGLIFYANIVRANHAVFFPPGDRSFFSLFIAWLNLDLGVETCFWDGLDGYAKTWLQFVFPVYIWVLVAIIIWLSRRYVLAAKLCGSHTVKVLATLFLLSYAKVLRTVITALSFTSPKLLDGSTITVWLYDGNVDYLGVKHAFLFFTALVFAVGFVLPFTLLVLLAPCLQAWSNKRFFRWVHRIKPLLDAYQGPYTDKFRCWTGVMLVVRNVLFLSFAANGLGDPEVNLVLITTMVLGFIQAFMWLPDKVYKVLILNILEAIFITKLGIFSAWTIFIRRNNPDPVQGQMIAAYTITTTTVIIFIAIVCYHIWIAITTSQIVKNLTRKLQRQQEVAQQEGAQQVDESGSAAQTAHAPTVTYINMSELRESLLS